MAKTDLPKEFVAFERLNFCSNILQNCDIPIIAIDGSPILLVGKGKQPQVWIWAIINIETKKLGPVVIANSNRILTDEIKVEVEDDSTCIKYKNNTVIIKVIKLSDEDAIIEQIDMRLYGFNIYGDSSTLNVGADVMVGNHVSYSKAFIELGL